MTDSYDTEKPREYLVIGAGNGFFQPTQLVTAQKRPFLGDHSTNYHRTDLGFRSDSVQNHTIGSGLNVSPHW